MELLVVGSRPAAGEEMAHALGIGGIATGIFVAALYLVERAESAGRISISAAGLCLFMVEFSILGALIIYIRRDARDRD